MMEVSPCTYRQRRTIRDDGAAGGAGLQDNGGSIPPASILGRWIGSGESTGLFFAAICSLVLLHPPDFLWIGGRSLSICLFITSWGRLYPLISAPMKANIFRRSPASSTHGVPSFFPQQVNFATVNRLTLPLGGSPPLIMAISPTGGNCHLLSFTWQYRGCKPYDSGYYAG